MSGPSGSDMQVLVKDAQAGDVVLAGLRAKSLQFKSRSVDITHLQSEGEWQELSPGASVKSAVITGEGIFANNASAALARAIFFAQDIRAYTFNLPDFGIITGAFLMTELSYKGSYDGEAAYELRLVSAGAPTFTPHM